MTSLPRVSITFTAICLCRPALIRNRDRALQRLESTPVGIGPERPGDLVPRLLVWEERLRRAEATAVVIRVEEPGGDFLRGCGVDTPGETIVGIHAVESHEVLAFLVLRKRDLRLAEDREKLAPRLLLQESFHARVDVRPDEGLVHLKPATTSSS